MDSAIGIGFDFDHTLGIDNKLERTVALQALERLAAERGVAYDVQAAELEADRTLVAYRDGGESVESAIAGLFVRFVPGLGRIALDEAHGFRDAVVARAPDFVRALPGVPELFDELDALGVRSALLTNGWSPLQEEKARLIGFRGSVLVSERIGARKPDAAAFDLLVSHLGVARDRAWYVGDDPSADVGGARAAGLRAVWFDWESRPFPPGIAPAQHVIHALGELPTLLRAAQGRPDGAANTAG